MTKAKNWQTCGREGCETLFTPNRANNIYCSARCRAQAYHAKHPGRDRGAANRAAWNAAHQDRREAGRKTRVFFACLVCDCLFHPAGPRNFYCSAECRLIVKNATRHGCRAPRFSGGHGR